MPSAVPIPPASPGGAGRNKTLGQNEFSLLRITLPPTKEQQKIAQILSTWDKAIEKLEALIARQAKAQKSPDAAAFDRKNPVSWV